MLSDAHFGRILKEDSRKKQNGGKLIREKESPKGENVQSPFSLF